MIRLTSSTIVGHFLLGHSPPAPPEQFPSPPRTFSQVLKRKFENWHLTHTLDPNRPTTRGSDPNLNPNRPTERGIFGIVALTCGRLLYIVDWWMVVVAVKGKKCPTHTM